MEGPRKWEEKRGKLLVCRCERWFKLFDNERHSNAHFVCTTLIVGDVIKEVIL